MLGNSLSRLIESVSSSAFAKSVTVTFAPELATNLAASTPPPKRPRPIIRTNLPLRKAVSISMNFAQQLGNLTIE